MWFDFVIVMEIVYYLSKMLIITFNTDESMRRKSEGAEVVETLNFGGQGVFVGEGGGVNAFIDKLYMHGYTIQ